MNIPQSARYALRVMAEMALLEKKKGGATRESLARKTHVPSHFLAKIMKKLVDAGLVTARRGVGGGFVLARPLKKIVFMDILHAVGYDFEPDQCLFGWSTCDASLPCPLHYSWAQMKNFYFAWAMKTSLDDVVKNQRSARNSLGARGAFLK